MLHHMQIMSTICSSRKALNICLCWVLTELCLLHGAGPSHQQAGRRRVRVEGQEENMGTPVRFRQKSKLGSTGVMVLFLCSLLF